MNVFFCALVVWSLALSSKNKTPRGLLSFLQSCDQCEFLRHPHLHHFPALKSALSGRHFRSNEDVRQAVTNFRPSLGTDFYQDGFLKLISRSYRQVLEKYKIEVKSCLHGAPKDSHPEHLYPPCKPLALKGEEESDVLFIV
ncbi:hypothetical protein AVEN_103559-1 [Araneus ventricosus]|uniref:Uncharacterized protein n=1 Tax=Araneus ventricosus TaxID=182803 RepID=A0A4Y2G431_ARAVE|nr:hypothetical protein AVEN_103559-1 [Araneus ventricosus]